MSASGSMQRVESTAFGDELTSSGTGARTSYIGRETDSKVNDRLTGSAIFYFVHNLPR
jgi:hypothetical protein